MTIQTETEKPALTYSKSKGLVTLVTGTELYIQTVFFFSNLMRSTQLIFLSFRVLQLS